MHFIDSVLAAEENCKKLLTAIERGRLPAVATGLSHVHRAAVVSAAVAQSGRPAAVVCPDEATATRFVSDLEAFGKEALLLPARDLPSAGVSSKEWEHKRIYTLSAAADGVLPVCVGSVEAFAQYTLPPEVLRQNTFTLCAGDSIKIDDLTDRLVSAGYVRCEQIEGPGQFAVRGGIFDLFPTGVSTPVRIEFWGDEIDTVSYFDLVTQRRGESIKRISVTPARETLISDEALFSLLEGITEKNKKLTDTQSDMLFCDLDALRAHAFSDYDKYLPVCFGKPATAADYFDGCLLFVCDSGGCAERLKNINWLENEDLKERLSKGTALPMCERYHLDGAETDAWFEKSGAVFLENFARASYTLPIKELIPLPYKALSPWRGGFEALTADLCTNTVIMAGSEKAARLLCEELCGSGRNAVFMPELSGLPRGITVTVGGVSGGMHLPTADFSLITHGGIPKSKKHRSLHKGKGINSLDELHGGDFVVHAVHGIGVFMGINKLEQNGVIKDYIKIQYAKGDMLYVPVTQLDLVSKYIGAAEDSGIKLNKLGGTEWQKTRTRVRAAVKDMAKQLTALYAKRMAVSGHAFSVDTDIQSDFERRFEYEETDDQLRCINEIKADMEKPTPMDRLLCGDVGFGKTEVALRAAFKCVSEGKQCVLMAPTTILAWQHYNTVLKRFGDFPLEVRLLSRFVSKSAQQKTITELRRGGVDMVIGTHRLISKDVSFRDLGLIIIDEEHRFGVAQKERLKELYPTVDVLTLSATPIPRTLNMAMSGLRDMSSIDEAPEDRLPVQTYVLEQDNSILLDAINRELRRGGQVYYLHNRVESIVACAARLKAQLPDTNIGIAHGKMDEEELSLVWKQLLEHEIDILVCTTIIETGVDIPNANTLIIENADRMGLSELHQLRGRVGRSPRRAYAYFCFKRGKALSEIAEKRLEAIREYTEFGSGFKIAMRDLEIRGAGSLLGGEQHGHLESVGYDMYLKLLSDAISEEKGEQVEEENNCVIDVQISAHIDERYIPSLPQRLGMYRRIADIRTEDDASDVIDELCDRFGDPPKAVIGLIDVALIRNRAAAAGITEIGQTGGNILLYVPAIDPEKTGLLLTHFKNRFLLSAGKKPYYSVRMGNGQSAAACLKEIMQVLSEGGEQK